MFADRYPITICAVNALALWLPIYVNLYFYIYQFSCFHSASGGSLYLVNNCLLVYLYNGYLGSVHQGISWVFSICILLWSCAFDITSLAATLLFHMYYFRIWFDSMRCNSSCLCSYACLYFFGLWKTFSRRFYYRVYLTLDSVTQ